LNQPYYLLLNQLYLSDSCDSEMRSRVWVPISGNVVRKVKTSVNKAYFAVIELSSWFTLRSVDMSCMSQHYLLSNTRLKTYMESMQLKKLIFWRLYKVNIGCIAPNSKISEIVECGLLILSGSSGFSCLLFVGTRFGTLFRLNGADLGTSVQKHHSEMISPKF